MAFVYRCGLFLMLCLYFMGDLTLARKCPEKCEKNYQPICGSNGVTYGNKCHFNMAKCKIQDLKIKHKGECETGVCPPPEGAGPCVIMCEDCKAGELCCSNGCGQVCMEAIFPKCPEICTEQYEPVCGSDNKTYANHCFFNNAKCEDPSLTIVHQGACTKCPEICTKEYEPVCGSDNKTYDNRCYFNNAKCNDPSLTIVHEGACKEKCPELCTQQYDPVCGSDGKTYVNDCELSVAICNNPAISKIGDGLCDGGTEMLKKK